MNQEILNYSDRINSYGSALKLDAIVNGMETPVIKSFTPIREILDQNQSLYVYLESIINSLNPNILRAVVKKSNGSGYKDPKTFELVISNQNTQPNNIVHSQGQMGGMGGFSSMPSDNTSGVLKMQLDFLQRDYDRLDRKFIEKDRLAEEFKEKYFEVKKQLDTINERNDLALQKKDLEQSNSLAGVVKELKPMLPDILEVMKTGKAPAKSESQLGGNLSTYDPNTKIGALITVFEELTKDPNKFMFYSKFFFRLMNTPEEYQQELSNILIQKTEDKGLDFNDFENLNLK